MANINVDYERLTSTAAQLDVGRDDLTLKIDELNRIIDGLVADGFTTSSASGAYQEAFTTYASGARNTIAGLTGLAQFLRQTADTLKQTDEGIAASIR